MSDLMREEFERQMTEDMVSKLGEGFRSSVALFFIDREPNGDYSNPIPYAGWWAWQASRECLVIELPKPAGLDRMSSEMSIQEIREDNRFNRALELAKKALTAAGVKYQ